MTSLHHSQHQKHTSLTRPTIGTFNRNELGIIAASSKIRQFIHQLIERLSDQYCIAYINTNDTYFSQSISSCSVNAAIEVYNSSNHTIRFQQQLSDFEYKQLLSKYDLVIVNNNDFAVANQILIIGADNVSSEALQRLNEIQCVLLIDDRTALPDYIVEHIPDIVHKPVFRTHQINEFIAFIKKWMAARLAPINGLVLSGGKSTRMLQDKGSILYHGISQRQYIYNSLAHICSQTYISYANEQAVSTTENLPYIVDKFLNLGPLSGILSAFQQQPDAAWLTVACDLPYLSAETLNYLVEHRNPSKLATAYLDSEGKFPEPLITIWEPRAYSVLLQFLSLGYSCPRKVLINSDVELLKAPVTQDLQNVNYPHERDEALYWAKHKQ